MRMNSVGSSVNYVTLGVRKSGNQGHLVAE